MSKKYTVIIQRERKILQESYLTIKADSEEEAEEKANNIEWTDLEDWDETDYEEKDYDIISISENEEVEGE